MENKGSVKRSGSKDGQGKRSGVKNSVQDATKEGKGAAKEGAGKEGAGGRLSRMTSSDERKRRQSAVAAAASSSTLQFSSQGGELEEEGDEDPLDFFDLGGLLG
eukprot:CAMPEP_0204177794 /NCGR_PEP_ID=MMETSP0361-20130328/48769_1 /ASSEMBLY_ACC=CAM_ASM_000343 /TAXON_ID=268821 /ORGANISM="Scrippsiella Hangoei, Strain SHTV-5" /LENGTH=103 /DNA_ID=CAMNT_0051136829 /DNA_START=20 /DNA_END=328 /DNA_ORIENTATION=+